MQIELILLDNYTDFPFNRRIMQERGYPEVESRKKSINQFDFYNR